MKRSISGFTIVELLIVIVVIAILAAISVVTYTGVQERARNSAHAQAASQAEKAIMTYALQTNSESISLSNTLIGYKEGPGVIQLLRPVIGAQDITMYVVYDVAGTSSNYPYLARMQPARNNEQIFQLNAGAVGDNRMGYRIDTLAQSNQTASAAGFRVPGSKIIGWLQVSNNATARAFGFNQAAASAVGALSAHSAWNFTSVDVVDGVDGVGRAAFVFGVAHDQPTRQQVISWLAHKYGVGL